MWEITIKCSIEHQAHLDYVEDMLVARFRDKIIIGRYNNFICGMSIATKDQYKKHIWEYLRRLLCDVFCKAYKTEFLEQNITFVSSNSPYFDAFIKVYTYFDLELEYSIAYKLIDYMSVVHLESYFAFRLSCLKNKWQDLCDITNNNSSAFLASDSFLSLLKFLVSNLDIKNSCVIVSVRDGCLSYIDTNNKQVVVPLGDQMTTICTLIELSPLKIVIHNKQNTNLEHLIVQLFDKRVECQKSDKKD